MLRSICLVSAILASGLFASACTHVRVSEVTGPDGSDWKLLTCSRLNKKCFEVAREMCPNGYYFARAKRAPAAREATPGTAASGPPPKVKTLPPQEDWDGGMYSGKSGELLVKCAEGPRVAGR